MPNVAMSAIRLFVPVPLKTAEDLWLDGERAHYLSRVLRIRRGDSLVAFDGRGGEYQCRVAEIGRHRVLLIPGDHAANEAESPLKLHLIQGISRGDRMDAVVQKATELGVHRISPVNTEFSVVRLDQERSLKKSEHWQRIAQSACEQCGRNTVPIVDSPTDLSYLLASEHTGIRVVLLPGSERPLTELPAAEGVLSLLIGPEGGFSDPERALALEFGFLARSLGPRILRTETAAIAAIALLQSNLGDLQDPAG
jgi:16S rRNA (uracil1498-N3)-methyltransferase